MAIQQTITNPTTQAVFTNAYGRIDDAALQLATGAVTVTLNWYFSQATAAVNATPVRPDLVSVSQSAITSVNPTFVAALAAALEAGKISAPIDALKTALYILLKQQDTYSSATDV